MKSKEDRHGCLIGTGKWHCDYKVFEIEDVNTRVKESDNTESVYVEYTNPSTGKRCVVRFSNHTCNAVEFGTYLDGKFATLDEVKFHLGLKKRKFIPQTRLLIRGQLCKTKEMQNFEEAELTIQEMYALGEGTDLTPYVGKRAKNGKFIVYGEKVERIEVTASDRLGTYLKGDFIYYD